MLRPTLAGSAIHNGQFRVVTPKNRYLWPETTKFSKFGRTIQGELQLLVRANDEDSADGQRKIFVVLIVRIQHAVCRSHAKSGMESHHIHFKKRE